MSDHIVQGPPSWPHGVDVVVLDVDGTLIDSNYHHVHAWASAFTTIGRPVPEWRIHQAIGMGGDRLVAAVSDEDVEDRLGDVIRRLHDEIYARELDRIAVLPGGHELIGRLRSVGFCVVAASSGTAEQTQAALDKIDDSDQLDGWVCGEDVDATKPDPEILSTALAKVGGHKAAAVGDSVWDMKAADTLGWYAIGLRCGGIETEALLDGGASVVFDDPADLNAHLVLSPQLGG